MFFKKKEAVGLDVSLDSVKVVKLCRLDGTLKLVGVGIAKVSTEPIDEDARAVKLDVMSRAIRKALEHAKIDTKRVYTSVAGTAVAIRHLKLPKMSATELRDVIRYEAEDHVPFDMESVILDFQILREVVEHEERFMDVLVVAAKEDFIYEHIEILRHANLEPLLIDVDAFAIQQCFEYTEGISKQDSVIAIVDIGARLTSLQIIEGRLPVFSRDIPLGGNDFTDAVARELQLSFHEAEEWKERHGKLMLTGEEDERIARASYGLESTAARLSGELDRSFAYYYTQLPAYRRNIETLILTGGGAKLNGLPELLANNLGMQVKILDAFKKIEIPLRFDQRLLMKMSPLFAVATGLSIRGLLT